MNIVKEEHLGSGAYGDVYKIIDKNNGNHVAALKAMKNGEDGDIREATIREICNTQNITHPNIIPVYPLVYNDGIRHAVYINENKNRIELSLEMMNGDINSIKKDDLTSVVLRKMVYDVTKGLYHMHSMGYTHNDLKPDNILYKLEEGEYTFKIGDFGLSQYLGIPFPATVTQFLCTITVKAPNSTSNSIYVSGNKYNYNSDMFSLGAVMFWLCMNRYGISWTDFRISENEVFVDIRKKNFLAQSGKLEKMYGEDGYDFILKCMAPKSSERMSSKKALEHPYLRPLKGGAIGDLLQSVQRMYKQPSLADIMEGNYEFEFIDDMYERYKDRRVNLYVDFASSTINLQPTYIQILNDWIYTAYNRFGLDTLETLLQTPVQLVRYMNIKKIGTDSLQLVNMCISRVCHKILSDFYTSQIDIDRFVWVSQGTYTTEQLTQTERDILQTFNGDVPITPIMFFLNYWYLKSIYTSERKEPNVKVLNASIAVMIVILTSNSHIELKDVKLDDLAKYCVKKALMFEDYTDSANVAILKGPDRLESFLNFLIQDFCISSTVGPNLYEDIRGIFKCYS